MIKQLFHKLFKDKNNRNVTSNVIWTFAIKGAAMLIAVLTVPAYTRYFGNDTVYGAWLTISAVFTWINMFDFGIGNGLRNCLVGSIAKKDDDSSKKYISSAYVSVGIISALLLLAGVVVSFFFNWNGVLKVDETWITPSVLRSFIQVVFGGVIVHFFLLLINSIFYALQRTFLPNLFSLITQGIILVYILIPNSGSLNEKLAELAVVYALAYNIPLVIATVILFSTKLKKVKPSPKYFNKELTKKILGLGGLFFMIQISLIALNSSNEVYINTFFSPADVTQYNYYHKLFYIITVFVSLLGQPIWSAITRAYCEKRYHWIMGMWKVLAGIAGLCVCGCILLAVLYQPIADIWLGKGKLIVEALPVSLFAIMTTQMAIINLSNCISNGLGKLKVQAIFTVLGAVLKLVFTFMLSNFMNAWYAVILATVLAELPLMIAQPLYIYRLIAKLDKTTVESEKCQEIQSEKGV